MDDRPNSDADSGSVLEEWRDLVRELRTPRFSFLTMLGAVVSSVSMGATVQHLYKPGSSLQMAPPYAELVAADTIKWTCDTPEVLAIVDWDTQLVTAPTLEKLQSGRGTLRCLTPTHAKMPAKIGAP